MSLPESPSDITIDTASQLHRSALRLLRMVRATRPESGLGLAKFGVLSRLSNDGIATATSLAAYLRIQPQSVTRLLAELERDQWIVRQPDPADRRRNLIEITEAGGRVLQEEIRAQQVRLAQIMAESLTPAEQQMVRLAAGLMDQLAAAAAARISANKNPSGARRSSRNPKD